VADFIIGQEGIDSAAAPGMAAFIPPSSPMLSLKKRREAIVNDLYIDLQVPRWNEPEIFVRFKPASATRINAIIERRRKQKAENWSLLTNADVLVDCCVGVYAVHPDEPNTQLSLRENDSYGSWTKFDHELAAALGVDVDNNAECCIALYMTEGDLIDTANKLFRWSNIANDEADATF